MDYARYLKNLFYHARGTVYSFFNPGISRGLNPVKANNLLKILDITYTLTESEKASKRKDLDRYLKWHGIDPEVSQ